MGVDAFLNIDVPHKVVCGAWSKVGEASTSSSRLDLGSRAPSANVAVFTFQCLRLARRIGAFLVPAAKHLAGCLLARKVALCSLQDLEGFCSLAQTVQGKGQIIIERRLVRVSQQGPFIVGDGSLQIGSSGKWGGAASQRQAMETAALCKPWKNK